ncbi:DUF928 domain-containing protein [Scytonema sp. UIC 10036]|uniref:DUF928 domain-containing protein n=1 Tax=Scytonema sp. UIC 10036 TaxID=2304196 RepID=UPI0012DA2BB4|nr:DUF928 domain-containing protein [Scytonema sp. UIC 10036]MUG95302.1 DUF928 domain-containing protein [Scytonema sp. UIC 10036]
MNTFLQRRLLTKSLAAVFGLSFLIPFTAAEARIRFNAPTNIGVPGRRVPAGSRENNSCLSGNKKLTAIVPQSNIGLTTVAKPVFFFYIPPQTSNATLELVVQDENKRFFKQTYKPSGKAGFVDLPLTATSLEVGKEYRWFLSVICDREKRSSDKVVRGAIKRIQPEPQLMAKIKNATSQERVALYAQAGIWQDSLATLAQLRFSRPHDAQLKADWETLLTAEGVGLDPELVNEPLLKGQEAPQPIARYKN